MKFVPVQIVVIINSVYVLLLHLGKSGTFPNTTTLLNLYESPITPNKHTRKVYMKVLGFWAYLELLGFVVKHCELFFSRVLENRSTNELLSIYAAFKQSNAKTQKSQKIIPRMQTPSPQCFTKDFSTVGHHYLQITWLVLRMVSWLF